MVQLIIFCFSLKRHPHEGPTSFSSRFRTQLDRLQNLIAQERELHRAKKQKTRKTSSHAGVDDNSSVGDSEPPDADVLPEVPAPSGSPDTSEHETAQEAAASSSDHDQRAATEPIRSKPPSSIGRDAGHLKRKQGSDGRGSFKADKDKSHRKMQQTLAWCVGARSFETKTYLSPEHLGPPLHEEVWIVPRTACIRDQGHQWLLSL